MKEGYVYNFEDRISKEKLPRGLSYVLQTKDITSVLSTDGLCLHYNCMTDNPQKLEKQVVKNFSFTKVELLSYTKYAKRWGEPGSMMDYNRNMSIYSVPAKIRYRFRNTLTYKILPFLKDLESKPKFHVSVYYRTFHKNNYEPQDWGGIYIEQDRYGDKPIVLYRDKEFDMDKEIKEIVT
jgi:hypothetical protein